MSGIRVTYSGLINFIIGLIRIFTGFAFIIIVTRLLTPEEFGTWNLIVGLITYTVIIHHVISYWTTREISRGIESGRTAILSAGLFSVLGMIIFIGISYFVLAQTAVERDILLFATILVPIQLLWSVLKAISLGWKPQASSYGLIIIDLSKIPTAFLFLYFFDMGIIGVILSVFIGILTGSIFLATFSRNKLKNTFQIEILKSWLKRSWLPLYPSMISIIHALDVLIFTIIVGSTEGVGYYSAALVIGSLASYAGLTTIGIYPKLLAEEKRDYIRRTLTRLFYFLIPMGILSIVFARPGLYALNPLYEIVALAVAFLTLRTVLFTLFDIFSYILRGLEQVDIQKNSTFKDYIKSKLFFIPTLQLIQYSSYIITLTIVLILVDTSLTERVLYWSIISFVIQIPFTIIIFIHLRKKLIMKFEYVNITKYFLTGIGVFSIAYLLAEQYLEYTTNVFVFLPRLSLFVGFGIILYLLITYITDLNTRHLLKSIIEEIKK